MSRVIDGRKTKKDFSQKNHKRFLERYKEEIKKRVMEDGLKRSIKDIAGHPDYIDIGSTDEREFTYSPDPNIILPGNDQYHVGDIIDVEKQGGRSGGSGEGDESEDPFSFSLSKEDFLDVFFEDMELPDFIKKSCKRETTAEWVSGGFTKYGVPPRLSIKKTFEQAIARRLANRTETHEPAFLDESDLRYIRKFKITKPVMHAVMFCVLDVSASMEEKEKLIAKKYFLFLYLFLTKFYNNIDIVFIRHHHAAEEVDEYEFFHGRKTGGTIVSKSYELIKDIIAERYDASSNIYIAQASDGDNWPQDSQVLSGILRDSIIPVVQYLTYLQVVSDTPQSMWVMYKEFSMKYDNVNLAIAREAKDIYYVFRKLFSKRKLI